MAKSKELCIENVCIAPRFGKESMCEYHHKRWQKSWDDYNEKFLRGDWNDKQSCTASRSQESGSTSKA